MIKEHTSGLTEDELRERVDSMRGYAEKNGWVYVCESCASSDITTSSRCKLNEPDDHEENTSWPTCDECDCESVALHLVPDVSACGCTDGLIVVHLEDYGPFPCPFHGPDPVAVYQARPESERDELLDMRMRIARAFIALGLEAIDAPDALENACASLVRKSKGICDVLGKCATHLDFVQTVLDRDERLSVADKTRKLRDEARKLLPKVQS